MQDERRTASWQFMWKKKTKRKTQRDLIDAVIGIACRQLGVTQDWLWAGPGREWEVGLGRSGQGRSMADGVVSKGMTYDWILKYPSYNGQSSFKMKKMVSEAIDEKGW